MVIWNLFSRRSIRLMTSNESKKPVLTNFCSGKSCWVCFSSLMICSISAAVVESMLIRSFFLFQIGLFQADIINFSGTGARKISNDAQGAMDHVFRDEIAQIFFDGIDACLLD